MQRHINDEYVRLAQKAGYRSRAAYKLLEIQAKDRCIKPGQLIIDLGAAPGGWLQVAQKAVGPQGAVIGLDLLEIAPLHDVQLIQGDFSMDDTLTQLKTLLENRPVDLVISDMAPNVSGINAVDQPRSMYLCELALDFCDQHLKPGGGFICKVFQGEGFDNFIKSVRNRFNRVVTRKPKASRPKSREVYLVASHYRQKTI